MKVSKTQLEVLCLMADGWELGQTASGGNSSYWIQKGGLGRGGKVKKIGHGTGYALYKKGLIETASSKFRYPTSHYCLTEKGRNVVGMYIVSNLSLEFKVKNYGQFVAVTFTGEILTVCDTLKALNEKIAKKGLKENYYIARIGYRTIAQI